MTSQAGLGDALIAYLLIVVAIAIAVALRFLTRRGAAWTAAAFGIWLAYVWGIGRFGIAANHASFPPGLAIMLVPVVAGVLAWGLSRPGGALSAAIPLWLLVGFESFRVGVELVLSELHRAGLAPRLLTLPGGNVEILFALTAPLAAWTASGTHPRRGLLLGWNFVGLLSLVNVASRAVLSAPGPLQIIHAEVPDMAVITYPFTFIPGFMAPFALLLHILAIRSLIHPPQPSARRRTV